MLCEGSFRLFAISLILYTTSSPRLSILRIFLSVRYFSTFRILASSLNSFVSFMSELVHLRFFFVSISKPILFSFSQSLLYCILLLIHLNISFPLSSYTNCLLSMRIGTQGSKYHSKFKLLVAHQIRKGSSISFGATKLLIKNSRNP